MYVTIAYYEGFRNQYTAAEQHRENKPSAQINTNKYMGREFIMLNNFWEPLKTSVLRGFP